MKSCQPGFETDRKNDQTSNIQAKVNIHTGTNILFRRRENSFIGWQNSNYSTQIILFRVIDIIGWQNSNFRLLLIAHPTDSNIQTSRQMQIFRCSRWPSYWIDKPAGAGTNRGWLANSHLILIAQRLSSAMAYALSFQIRCSTYAS